MTGYTHTGEKSRFLCERGEGRRGVVKRCGLTFYLLFLVYNCFKKAFLVPITGIKGGGGGPGGGGSYFNGAPMIPSFY